MKKQDYFYGGFLLMGRRMDCSLTEPQGRLLQLLLDVSFVASILCFVLSEYILGSLGVQRGSGQYFWLSAPVVLSWLNTCLLWARMKEE